MCLIGAASATMVQREPLLTWSPTEHKGFKKNYFVPNFGAQDADIAATYSSLATTETKLNHKLGWSKADKGHDKDYFVPQFGMDADVATSLKNLKDQEAEKGKWDLPKDDWFVQTEAIEEQQREPLLTWSPTGHKSFKKDYFVPNFGPMDNVVGETYSNLANAEKSLSHHWDWSKKKSAKTVFYDTGANKPLDELATDSLDSLNASEAKFGKWNLPAEE